MKSKKAALEFIFDNSILRNRCQTLHPSIDTVPMLMKPQTIFYYNAQDFKFLDSVIEEEFIYLNIKWSSG